MVYRWLCLNERIAVTHELVTTNVACLTIKSKIIEVTSSEGSSIKLTRIVINGLSLDKIASKTLLNESQTNKLFW